MLVLERKLQSDLLIGDEIVVKIVQIGSKTVKLGVTAPKSVRILRAELVKKETKSDRNRRRV